MSTVVELILGFSLMTKNKGHFEVIRLESEMN